MDWTNPHQKLLGFNVYDSEYSTTEELSRRGRGSRRKGHNFERKCANLLRDIYPEIARGLQSRGGTGEVPDLEGTPFYFECKKGARTNPKAAYKQALEGTMAEHRRTHGNVRPPIAITQDDRSHILVTMDLATFKMLVKDD